MAGDWIKIENVTPSKPEIDVIAECLDLSVNEVIGGLVRLWIWADQQTLDGNAVNVTKSAIDRNSGVSGLAEVMLSERVRWLLKSETGGFIFPNFDRHNGQTAKTRALTAKRVATHKQRSGNALSVSSALPREEKRREEKSNDHRCSWLRESIERSIVKDWCNDRFSKLFPQASLKKTPDTRDMLLRVAVLRLCGAVSEAFVEDGLEALRNSTKRIDNAGSYLRTVWSNSKHLPDGSDFNGLLEQVELPPGI